MAVAGREAVANFEKNNVTVILPGGFAKNYAVGVGPVALAAGDFNGDGYTDLAIANSGDSTVSFLFGVDGGAFNAAGTIPLSTAPASLAVADFNGDGRADIAVALPGANAAAILIGQGDGTFLPEARFAAGTQPSSLVVADFNNDGLADIAADQSVEQHGQRSIRCCLGRLHRARKLSRREQSRFPRGR